MYKRREVFCRLHRLDSINQNEIVFYLQIDERIIEFVVNGNPSFLFHISFLQ